MLARSLAVAVALGLALGLVGCKGSGSSEKMEPPKKVERTVYKCSLDVAKKAGEEQAITGTGEGANEEKANEAAWAAACEKLAEADRPACKDSDRFHALTSGGSITSSGKTKHSVTITLTPLAKRFSGQSATAVSADQACIEATIKACEAAGEKGDCTSGGAYEKSNVAQMSETTTETVPGN